MKTTWQKIYSFFGFWTYRVTYRKNLDWTEYLTVYWCCFPWKFYRKFDVFRIKIDEYKDDDQPDNIRKFLNLVPAYNRVDPNHRNLG